MARNLANGINKSNLPKIQRNDDSRNDKTNLMDPRQENDRANQSQGHV